MTNSSKRKKKAKQVAVRRMWARTQSSPPTNQSRTRRRGADDDAAEDLDETTSSSAARKSTKTAPNNPRFLEVLQKAQLLALQNYESAQQEDTKYIADYYYYRGDNIPVDEDRVHEFKAVQKSTKPIEQILRYCDSYINAFLNSGGGNIYFGIEDNGTILGIPLARKDRDTIRLGIDNIVNLYYPQVDPLLYLVQFVRIKGAPSTAAIPIPIPTVEISPPNATTSTTIATAEALGDEDRDYFVVKVSVHDNGQQDVVYFTRHPNADGTPMGDVWMRRDGGITKMAPATIHDRKRRGSNTSLKPRSRVSTAIAESLNALLGAQKQREQEQDEVNQHEEIPYATTPPSSPNIVSLQPNLAPSLVATAKLPASMAHPFTNPTIVPQQPAYSTPKLEVPALGRTTPPTVHPTAAANSSPDPTQKQPTVTSPGSGTNSLAKIFPTITRDTIPKDFIGRVNEINEIVAFVNNRESSTNCKIVLLYGPPCVGKSTLARRMIVDFSKQFPNAQFVVDLKGITSPYIKVLDAMMYVIRINYPTIEIPEAEHQLKGLYLSCFTNRKTILFIENAGSADQILSLMPSPVDTCLVIVTSRKNLALQHSLLNQDINIIHKKLTPLSEDDALLLLLKHIGDNADEQQAREIVRLCGSLPLPIRIVGGLLARRPNMTLGDMIRQLQNMDKRLELVELGFEQEQVFYILDKTQQQDLMGISTIFQGPFDLTAASEVMFGSNSEQALEHLGELLDNNLIEYSTITRRYSQNDLYRLFVAKKATALARKDKETQAIFQKWQRKFIVYYHDVLMTADNLREQYEEKMEVTQGQQNPGIILFELEKHNFEMCLNLLAVFQRKQEERRQRTAAAASEHARMHLAGKEDDLNMLKNSPLMLITPESLAKSIGNSLAIPEKAKHTEPYDDDDDFDDELKDVDYQQLGVSFMQAISHFQSHGLASTIKRRWTELYDQTMSIPEAEFFTSSSSSGDSSTEEDEEDDEQVDEIADNIDKNSEAGLFFIPPPPFQTPTTVPVDQRAEENKPLFYFL